MKAMESKSVISAFLFGRGIEIHHTGEEKRY